MATDTIIEIGNIKIEMYKLYKNIGKSFCIFCSSNLSEENKSCIRNNLAHEKDQERGEIRGTIIYKGSPDWLNMFLNL